MGSTFQLYFRDHPESRWIDDDVPPTQSSMSLQRDGEKRVPGFMGIGRRSRSSFVLISFNNALNNGENSHTYLVQKRRQRPPYLTCTSILELCCSRIGQYRYLGFGYKVPLEKTAARDDVDHHADALVRWMVIRVGTERTER